MRAEAVEHIKSNYESYKFAIQGHVYDIEDEKQRNGIPTTDLDIEKECLFLLNNCLSKNRCWTGPETMNALSIIYKVNIVVINENGPVHIPHSHDKTQYDNTILLAHRIASSTEQSRNHYDSVTDISSDAIYSIAQTLSK